MKTLLSLLLTLVFSSSHAGYNEGIDAFSKGDHKTAIYQFEKALEDNPDLDIYDALGLVYFTAPEDIDNDYKKTFKAYLEAAKKPNTHARLKLADLYHYGQGTEIDLELSLKWQLKVIEHTEDRWGLWRVGKKYMHGLGVQTDYKKAFDYFARADKKNDSNSQFELGHIYEYGKGVEKDINKAIEYYQKSAKQGDSEAQYKIDILTGKISESDRDADFDLALNYTYGYTVKRDFNKAIEYFKKGAAKGHAPSLYNLGFLTSEISRTKQHSLVSSYYLKSAELGYLFAQKAMSTRYLLGIGVDRDKEKSFYWESQSAKQENPESIYDVAESYVSGNGVEKNYEKAIENYTKSAKLGYAESYYRLAQMHEKGLGLDQDFDKALGYFIKSAEGGYDGAQNELADLYYKGKKVKQDMNKSFYWAKKAANQGYPDSQNKMGVLYEKGFGVKQDLQKALEWYNKAADQGNEKAYLNLGIFYFDNKLTKHDEEKAFNWFMKAAKLKNAEGQYWVGNFYDLGIHVAEDNKEALKWYKKAADNDDYLSQIGLGNLYYYGNDDMDKNYQKAAKWYKKAALNKDKEDEEIKLELSVSGSGFFVTPNHIITNNHVTKNCEEISVKNKNYESKVAIFDTDAKTDLSILTTGKPSKHFLSFRDRKPLSTGESSITLGYPFSSDLGSSIKVTTGNIAALTGFRNNIAQLQLTSPVQPGNSGGPLLDNNGNVIGVIVSRLERSSEITGDRPAQNVNFAIKSNMVKIFMDLNRVNYQESKDNGSKDVSQIVNESKGATVQVICKNK